MPPLNILYLHSHDTGRYIQPYGHPVSTPHLQAFAEQGVLFRQAHCANPTCSPSRAALLTGSYPNLNGMVGLAHRGARLNNYQHHLANFLHSHGYETALAGIQHEIKHDEISLLGYDHFLEDPATLHTDLFKENLAHAAANFILRPHAKPFFLSCGFLLTHRTGEGTQWHNWHHSPTGDPRYTRPPAILPDNPTTRQDFADFAVAAHKLDQLMHTVIDAVDRAGLASSTLIICTTDHGIAFPGMKCNLTDHGTGVFLILRGPNGFGIDRNAGTVLDAMVSHMDLFPTICDLAGLEHPPWLNGKSLVPLVNGSTAQLHDQLITQVNYHAAYEPMRAVRTARYKYIRRFDPLPHPVLPNCDDSVSKNLLLDSGWRSRPPANEFLFDLIFDPQECNNLAANPAYANALSEMRNRLDTWMHQNNDPLLRGPVPPSPNMVVNSVVSLSPSDPTSPA